LVACDQPRRRVERSTLSGIRSELVHHFNAALSYEGGCTQHQREDAHYERGRRDGLGQPLELLDTFLRSEDGHAGRRRGAEEIAADPP
jgi:hypothetical protein